MARIIPDPNTSARLANRPDAPGIVSRRVSPLARLARIFWPVFSLFLLGVIAGLLYLHFRGAPPTPEGQVPKKGTDPSDNAALVMALRPGETPTLARGDEYLQEGRYDYARAIYQMLDKNVSAGLGDALEYRTALCEEGLGHNDQALESYRALASRDHPVAVGAAQVCQARILIRLRKPAEAKNLLFQLLLRSGQPELKDQPYLADAHYLTGLALTLEAASFDRPGPLNDTPAAYTASAWPVESTLHWVTPTVEPKAAPAGEARDAGQGAVQLTSTGDDKKPGKPPAPEKPKVPAKGDEEAAKKARLSNYVVVHQPSPGPGQALVSAMVPQGPLGDLLERIAAQAKLKVEWTDIAIKAVNDRNVQVDFSDFRLPEVFLALTDPLGLVAILHKDVLKVSGEAEVPVEAASTFRMGIAEHILTSTLAAYPGHPLASAAYLELGNIDARAGRLDEAAAQYEQVLRRCPVQPWEWKAATTSE